MKKTLLALAALTAFAGAASAQSSVTLFGVIDLNYRNQSNGSAGSFSSISTDGNTTSRLGFRGVEDLGGGLKAEFWLEGAHQADTGATTLNFARKSTVGLKGGFGEVRLGRDYIPSFAVLSATSQFATTGVGNENTLVSNLGAVSSGQTVRSDNTIQYFLPSLGGVYGNVMYGLTEANKATGKDKLLGLRVGYAAGPVDVAIAQTTIDTGTTPNFKYLILGGKFKAGPATITASWAKNSFGSVNQKRMLIGGAFSLGKTTLKAEFHNANGSIDRYDAKQISMGVVHDLSKRTAVYAHYSRINNGGSGTTGATFVNTGSGPSGIKGGETAKGYEFGVRHSF